MGVGGGRGGGGSQGGGRMESGSRFLETGRHSLFHRQLIGVFLSPAFVADPHLLPAVSRTRQCETLTSGILAENLALGERPLSAA